MTKKREITDSGDITIRSARLADAPTFASLAIQLGYPSAAYQLAERLAAIQANSEHLILAAELAVGVVGWAHAFVRHSLESDLCVEVAGLVVDKSHRGQGVGAALITRVEDWARETGVGIVTVRSNVIRSEAHTFYLARGFELIKTQHTFRKSL